MGKSSGNRRGRKVYPTGIGFDDHIMAKYREGSIEWVNFMDLYNLAIGRFQWVNIDDHKFLSTRVLEESLIMTGSVVFFRNDILGILALPSANSGKFDINNIPMYRTISRANGFHTTVTQNNSVLCFNDDSMMSFIPIIEYYADKMTQLDLTIVQNLKLQRRPRVIATNSDNENSVKQMLNNVQEYLYPYILVEESIIKNNTPNKDNTYVLDLSVPFIADKLRIERDHVRNEYLTRLGINNTRYEKKERMTNDEIAVNNEEINSYRYTALKCRKEACHKINEMFGTNIDVRYAVEENNNVGIYNNTTGNNIPENTTDESVS